MYTQHKSPPSILKVDMLDRNHFEYKALYPEVPSITDLFSMQCRL